MVVLENPIKITINTETGTRNVFIQTVVKDVVWLASAKGHIIISSITTGINKYPVRAIHTIELSLESDNNCEHKTVGIYTKGAGGNAVVMLASLAKVLENLYKGAWSNA